MKEKEDVRKIGGTEQDEVNRKRWRWLVDLEKSRFQTVLFELLSEYLRQRPRCSCSLAPAPATYCPTQLCISLQLLCRTVHNSLLIPPYFHSIGCIPRLTVT